ncbi:MAG: hypothetical protein OXU33_00920 [Gemmatimonadota bacterium]|nr:hypothetical protein [Gemmatimonadota bacterium]MDE3005371.1 hypothetical protein [Gemmatimonadota bacterium]MDE3012622.1 hypothetical protein [Gemmatimonadota bacterium]
MKNPHFKHAREHLERVCDGYAYIPDPESIYLFIGLQADAPEGAARLAVRNWVPFVAATASREGLIPVG